MELFGFTIARTKALQDLRNLNNLATRGGWWPIIRESWAGAWQANEEISVESVIRFSAVFACVTLVASDIGKMRLRLVEQDANGIWTETKSPSFSPVLRKPNRYQNRIKFIEQWITSKLLHGNTYVLKQRDDRGVVVALYLLDPSRVTPLVAPDGSVFYELRRDDLSGLFKDRVVVPASEIIHDLMVALYHPLIGVSPLFACGNAALQGLRIQNNSTTLFANGSNPGGVLTAPGTISQETALRLKEYWDENFSGDNVGKVAVLGDGLKYEAMSLTAVEAQLIEQLKWTGETVCSCFHVPAYMVGIGPPPNYNNIEALSMQYYTQCLQSLIESLELSLDEGLGLVNVEGKTLGTEFDLDDLLRMDTSTRMKAAGDGVGSGTMSPNEARARFHNLPPVQGGETPYLQQQNYSLSALDRRDQAMPAPATPGAPTTPTPAEPAPEEDATDKLIDALETKALEVLCAA